MSFLSIVVLSFDSAPNGRLIAAPAAAAAESSTRREKGGWLITRSLQSL